jgi:hypothetical protein
MMADMDPVTVIVSALAFGASAGLKDTASAAVKDAYATLKSLITRRYKVDVNPVETRPDSEAKRASLEEDLAAAGADTDAELLEAARQLLAQVKAAGSVPALGVDLKQAEAAALRIRRVFSDGAGVRVRGSKFSGNIEISDVHAGTNRTRNNP